MNRIKKIITLILVILLILTSTGTILNTSANSSIPINNGKIANVAVILHRLNDPYQVRIRESLESIEKERKNNVKFTFFDSKNNIAIQNEIIDSVLKENFDLLVVNLADKKENIVASVIDTVKQRNLPLILVNIPSEVVAKTSKLYDKVAFITSDSMEGGIKQSKIIVDLWNSNKKDIDRNGDNILQYVLLQGDVNDPQAIDRTEYVLSTINNSGIPTQQLELIRANWLRDLAKSSIESLFLKYSVRIEAIISNSDAMAIGAIEALQKYEYNKGDESKNIVVVGFDGLPEALDLIDKGFMTGTIIQDPNIAAVTFYTVGMNLINNLNPIENTNYKIENGIILIPYPYDLYIGKSNNP